MIGRALVDAIQHMLIGSESITGVGGFEKEPTAEFLGAVAGVAVEVVGGMGDARAQAQVSAFAHRSNRHDACTARSMSKRWIGPSV